MTLRRLACACLAAALAGCNLPAAATPTHPAAGTPGRTPLLPLPPTPAPTPSATAAPSTRTEWPPAFNYGTVTAVPTAIPTQVPAYPFGPDVVNILLIGSDRRDGLSYRTDTLILLSIDKRAGAAALLSVPRDLFVYLPGYTMQRINSADHYGEVLGYPGGGPSMLADAFLYNLGIRVDYQARIEMGAFRQLIDTLGGIDVRVGCTFTDWRLRSADLDPEDEDSWSLYTVEPAVVHMDGDLALWYARARSHSSDFDRARRQQEILRAIFRQALRLELVSQLPSLYTELTSMVSTDLPVTVLVQLAAVVPRLGPAEIRSRFIGRDQVSSWRVPATGALVLVPKAAAIRGLLEEALDFSDPDPLVPPTYVTVEVINASSNPDWAWLAAERMEYAGFRTYIGSDSSAPHSTRLIDFGTQASEVRQRLTQALGLPGSWIEADLDPDSPFPYRLIVGDNYDPCFDPTRGQGG